MTPDQDAQKVFVIDDDADVRDSLKWLLESVGLSVDTFENALEFIDQYPGNTSGCIVMDVRMARQSAQSRMQERYNSLTRREKQVMGLIVKGLSNQEAADELGINRKTVEGHRAHMMAKMKVDSLAELVQIAIALELVETVES